MKIENGADSSVAVFSSFHGVDFRYGKNEAVKLTGWTDNVGGEIYRGEFFLDETDREAIKNVS